jgi:para-nitrobenzyl esterase
MSASWVQFAKTGNPNVDGQANWPIYNLKDDVMRSYSPNAEIITGMLKERVDYQLLHIKKLYTSN